MKKTKNVWRLQEVPCAEQIMKMVDLGILTPIEAKKIMFEEREI